ncbi:hypothetical protein BIV59_04755 [Bacillus sp. MUM 13]|nr:hypothetical protein BIV59_04755 [Bacillus sp. MUM 13]
MRDSCGNSRKGRPRRHSRGGSPPAPRKASILERKSTTLFHSSNPLKVFSGKKKESIADGFLFRSYL